MAEPKIQPGCHSCSKALFCHTTVTTVTLSDLMNSRTNELHTAKEWRYYENWTENTWREEWTRTSLTDKLTKYSG